MPIPGEIGGNWRTWTVGANYEQASPNVLEPTSLQHMVKAATALVGDLPLDKLAATDVTTSNIWRHKDAHPYVLLLLLVDKYGDACLQWHPELLQVRMTRDKIAPSNAVWTKILACRVLLTSTKAWDDWQTFHWTALGLSGKSPNFGLLEEPEIANLIQAAGIMRAAHPERPFGEEVQKFLAASLRNESLLLAPSPVEFCQDELDNRKLECANCKAIHRDDGDRVCITCGKEELKSIPHPFSEELAEMKTLWKGVKEMPLELAVDYLPKTYQGNSVYRLAVCWHDTLESQKALASQLLLLGKK